MSKVNEKIGIYRKFKDKISYSKSLNQFGFIPHEAQQKVVDVVDSKSFDVLSMVCGRRFGKSELVSAIADTELLIPNARVLLVTPTFANAKAIYDKVELAILKKGLKIVSKDSKLLTFTLAHGASIVCATPKSISNVLGFFYSLVIFDESQDIPNLVDIWENKINPAQADYGVQEDGYSYSKTIFIGTARDYDNDFYIPFERGVDGEFGYISFTFPTESNPYISKSYLKKKQDTLPKKIFDMEYGGKWQTLKDSVVYFAFNEEKNIISHSVATEFIHNSKQNLMAIDFGFSDNTGALTAVVQPLTGKIVIVGEYLASQLPLEEHIKGFKALEFNTLKSNMPVLRYTDPSAVQLISDMANTYGYYTTGALNPIQPGIDKINELFHQGKLLISSECKNLIAEIKNMTWKNPKTKEVMRTKRFKHFDLALSTLRYLVYTWEMQKEMSIQSI